MTYKYLYVPGEAVDGSEELDAEVIREGTGWQTHTKGESLNEKVAIVEHVVEPTIVQQPKNQQGPLQAKTQQPILPNAGKAPTAGRGFGGPLGLWKFPILSRIFGPKWGNIIDPAKTTGTPPNLKTDTLILNKDTLPFSISVTKSFTYTDTTKNTSTGEILQTNENMYAKAPFTFNWYQASSDIMKGLPMEIQIKIIEIGEKTV